VSGAEQEQQMRPSDSQRGMADFVTAVNHPLRVQMLAILTNREASPVQLSRELGEEKGVCAYHCRKLEELGMIEFVWERPVRGSTEHFYRATRRAWFDAEEWTRLDPSVRSVASAWTVDRLIQDATGALNSGTFDRRADRHLSRAPIILDNQAWKAVSLILDRALDEVLQQEAEAAERMASSGGDPIPTVVGMLSFELPTPDPRAHDVS